jgi:predicted nuclease of restriction endonuclease-like (RecB) superfamily
MPVKNDARSAGYLVQQLNESFKEAQISISIFLVDDASSKVENALLRSIEKDNQNVCLVQTKARLGHQRALLMGVRESSAQRGSYSNLILMDSDGEDKAEHAVKLAKYLLENQDFQVVFSQRGKRYSSRSFVVLYSLFSRLFRRLTGVPLDVGNFMAIKGDWVKILLNLPHVSNHIAMSAQRYAPNSHKVLNDRGSRYLGKSKMNFSGLALHGYGAISVYADIILSRMLLVAIPSGLIAILSSVVLALMKFFGLANFLQGWVSIVSLFLLGFGLLTVIQLVTTTLILLSIQRNDNEQD